MTSLRLMTALKVLALFLAFLLLAIVILLAGLYLYWQATQPGGPVVIRSAREGVTLTVATETPGGWER